MKKDDRATYGSGTVYKQGNSYISQLAHTVEVDGKEYTKRITGSGKTETTAIRNRNKNAKKWEESLLKQSVQEAENDSKAADTGPTLNEIFELNLGIKGTNVQVSTSDNYESYYQGYIKNSKIGLMPIRNITEEDLLEFYMDKRKNGRKRTRKDKDGNPVDVKPLSINTVNHIRFVIYNTFHYAETKGYIEKNVHAEIKPFKSGTAAMIDYEQEDLDADSDDSDALQRIIPIEDINRILEYAFAHSRYASLYAWALNTGMREGECFGLKRINALPDSGYISVRKSLSYVKDRREGAVKRMTPILKRPKNGKERKVPYNQSLKNIYHYQITQIEKDKKAVGKLYRDKGLLFSDEYGDYLRPWKVLKEFQQILEILGIEKRRFHDLRHTFVSLLVKESQRAGEGISILEVSAIVGHSDPSITMNVYGGLFPNSTERAMKILDNCKAIVPTQLKTKTEHIKTNF